MKQLKMVGLMIFWQIKSNLYERQALREKVNNFQNTLPDVQSDLAMQTMKFRIITKIIFINILF